MSASEPFKGVLDFNELEKHLLYREDVQVVFLIIILFNMITQLQDGGSHYHTTNSKK